MKSDNIKKLVSILQNESEWISGTKLSQLIHVDKKNHTQLYTRIK